MISAPLTRPFSVSFLRSSTALVCGVLWAGAASAQLVPSADPGRVEDRLTSPTSRFQELQQRDVLQLEQTQLITPPPGASEVTFTLNSLSIDGATAYNNAALQALHARYRGQTISLATVYTIAAELQQRYIDDGFGLTRVLVPAQDLDGGHIRLVVVEGHVAEIEIDPTLESNPALDDAIAQIKSMKPINTLKLERLLLIINDLPDQKVSAILATPKLASSQIEPGALRLIVKKNTGATAPRGMVGFNNYGSQYTGPWQATAQVNVYDVGFDNSTLSFTALGTAPLEEQRYGVVSYSVPLFGASGTTLSLSASRARTRPGDALKAVDIDGTSITYAASVAYPLIRQRGENWTVHGDFEWKEVDTDFAFGRFYHDDLRVATIGTNYSFSDTWNGFNAFDVAFAKGLDALGASDRGDPLLSRADGDPAFEKVTFFAGRVQGLGGAWSAFGLVSGQYTRDPLLSSEEFGFGGQLGRGYDPSEMTGDRGIAGTLELRYDTNFTALNQSVTAQPYLFYDIGKVWNIDAGAKDDMSGASAGIGSRFAMNQHWQSELLAAFPLTKPAENPPGYTNDTGPRFLFNLSRNF